MLEGIKHAEFLAHHKSRAIILAENDAGDFFEARISTKGWVSPAGGGVSVYAPNNGDIAILRMAIFGESHNQARANAQI